jgi:hypothetical protein
MGRKRSVLSLLLTQKNLFASARWGEKLFVTPSAARRLKKLRKNRR